MCVCYKAKIASVKEPVGLSRTDGKLPGGLTLVPWLVGKNLVRDATVEDAVTNSYLTSTSLACSAAELYCRLAQNGEIVMHCRYGYYARFRTSGFRNPYFHLFKSTCVVQKEIGRRLTLATGNMSGTIFIFQRLTVAI